jgi:hypothetical protein
VQVAHHVQRVVAASVVDQDDLPRLADAFQGRRQAPDELRQRRRFVPDGRDDRNDGPVGLDKLAS